MAALYCIASVGLKTRLIALLVRLSEDIAINPKYLDKIGHFGSTAYSKVSRNVHKAVFMIHKHSQLQNVKNKRLHAIQQLT